MTTLIPISRVAEGNNHCTAALLAFLNTVEHLQVAQLDGQDELHVAAGDIDRLVREFREQSTKYELYLVEGSCSRFSDKTTWVVEVCDDREMALGRISTLNSLLGYAALGQPSYRLRTEEPEVVTARMHSHPQGDRNFRWFDTAVTYTCRPVLRRTAT